MSLKEGAAKCCFLAQYSCHGKVTSAYRITFALEEKNLPYDSVLIELRNKPHWYKDIVPTELTPAAVINGDLVYESLDILKVRTALCALHLLHKMLWHCCRSAWESSAAAGLHTTGASAHQNYRRPFVRWCAQRRIPSAAAAAGPVCARCVGMRPGLCSTAQSPERHILLLQKLEAEFPEQRLLPESEALRSEADALMSQAEELSAAGFRSDLTLRVQRLVIIANDTPHYWNAQG